MLILVAGHAQETFVQESTSNSEKIQKQANLFFFNKGIARVSGSYDCC